MGRNNGTLQSNRLGLEQETKVDLDRGHRSRMSWPVSAPIGHRGLDRDGLLDHHERLCSEAHELMDRKNRDYASGDDNGDPFGDQFPFNF